MNAVVFQERFLEALLQAPPSSFLSFLNVARMAEISYAMDLYPIQDSFRFRCRYLGWMTANYLIDAKGEVDRDRAIDLLRQLEASPYPAGPKMEGDVVIYSHLIRCLKSFVENKEIGIWLKKFSLPLCHKKAEEMVRESLWPDQPKKIETPHVRRAALAAWLTFLRQTTGSCFATAPAILIQQFQPVKFFKDLYDLLSTGQLRRTIAGKGYTVPMSPTPGMGDLLKSLSSLEALSLAPGLRVALEAAGAFPSTGINGLRECLARIEGPVESVEKLLRVLLLLSLDLTEEEIAEEEHLARIQMTPLLAKQSAVYYQRPSERGKKVAEMRRRFASACSAFRSMTECSLLRAWEYSIASFCDVKLDFARWNLYVGLGFHVDQKGGIADFLYRTIDAKLSASKMEIEALHREYTEAFSNLHAVEALIQRSLNDAHRNQLKAEFASAMLRANSAQERRDREAARAEAIANTFPSLLRQYDEKLQDHFQEIFDPSVRGGESHVYEDSPAGFRLVYKHGRADASLWTLIHGEEEYLHSLRDFFSSIEQDLLSLPPLGSEFISEITTELVRYIQEPEFIASSKERARSQGRHSPWDYVSGGTMQSLVQNYLGREKPLTEESCIAHSERELFQFLKRSASGKKGSLLIHSPTHAFLFNPDWAHPHLEENLERCIQAAKRWKLDEEMKEYLAHRLSEQLPHLEKPLFLHLFRQKPPSHSSQEFRSHLIESLQAIPESRLKNPSWAVDSLFYEHFPLLRGAEARGAIESLVKSLIGSAPKIAIEESFIGSWALQQKVKELLFMAGRSPFSSRDWDREVAVEAQKLDLGCPAPLLFADSNWPGWFLGWVVNPASAQLELWRLNRTATQGVPMSEWKPFLSPDNQFPWILLPRDEEYISL